MTSQKKLIPQTIYINFRELGGIYVKFLQMLVLRSESFQSLRDYNIYDVYDQVNTEPIDIKAFLDAELGEQASEITLESENPFAAGSFGQVYLAKHKDKWVILKVLRPTIVSNLKFDLRILGILSRIIDWFSFGSAINMRSVHKEFARSALLETNYLLEADYASTLHERYKHHPTLLIPYTYRELSTARLICQDYVAGIAATDLISAAKNGLDIHRYVSETLGSDLTHQLVGLGSEILSSIFLHGTAYGDPHPGNIKFLPDNKVGLIDYGVQAPAPKDTLNFHRLIREYYKIYSGQPDLRGYSRVLLDLYGGDIIQAAHSLDEYYATGTHQLLDKIIDSAEQIMESQRELIGGLLNNNKMMMIFNGVINKNNQFCLEYNLDGPEIMRGGLLFISLVSNLGVKNDVLQQTYANVLERTKDVMFDQGKPTIHPETALEILASWFDQISYKNPQLYRRMKQEKLSYV
jgi:serine/threonine protein kinase